MDNLQNDPTSNLIEHSKVESGHIMAFVYWGRIKNHNRDKSNLQVEDLYNKQRFDVTGESLINSSLSADQYKNTEKVTKTKAAEILSSSFHIPLTVCFDKQDGKERVIRGRLLSTEPLLGRSYVEDLDLEGDSKKRLRLVDHRTIKWLIVQNVKYIVSS